MTQQYALLSIVYMMAFVIVLDRTHFLARNSRFCKDALLSDHDLDQLRNILSACEEN
ncbi:MAG TPA: hypothetical protein VKU19_18190 [Bryobacteraceae bacterium]|nr:hypothetical protein [Bryobacteraceae bacterium]